MTFWLTVTRDMWRLDVDTYNDATTRIGWDSSYQRVNLTNGAKPDSEGENLASSGWNMVSRILVTTDACPPNQNSRVLASEISYGYAVGGATGNPTTPSWLIEFTKTEHTPIQVDYSHTRGCD